MLQWISTHVAIALRNQASIITPIYNPLQIIEIFPLSGVDFAVQTSSIPSPSAGQAEHLGFAELIFALAGDRVGSRHNKGQVTTGAAGLDTWGAAAGSLLKSNTISPSPRAAQTFLTWALIPVAVTT